MIILILKMIFLTTVWVMMWKVLTSEEMLLEKVGKWGEKMSEKYKIFDGLITCQWCLPNIHGLFFVWPLALLMGVMPMDMIWYKYLAIYPFCAGGSSFASGMIWEFYLTQNRKRDYYENGQKHYYLYNKILKNEIKNEIKSKEDNDSE